MIYLTIVYRDENNIWSNKTISYSRKSWAEEERDSILGDKKWKGQIIDYKIWYSDKGLVAILECGANYYRKLLDVCTVEQLDRKLKEIINDLKGMKIVIEEFDEREHI